MRLSSQPLELYEILRWHYEWNCVMQSLDLRHWYRVWVDFHAKCDSKHSPLTYRLKFNQLQEMRRGMFQGQLHARLHTRNKGKVVTRAVWFEYSPTQFPFISLAFVGLVKREKKLLVFYLPQTNHPKLPAKIFMSTRGNSFLNLDNAIPTPLILESSVHVHKANVWFDHVAFMP